MSITSDDFPDFSNRRLLITGGTGSFGNAVLSRLMTTNVGEILIFSRDEKKQDDMRQAFNNERLRFVIGDVRDRQSLDLALAGVDYVFHAAALKQVPGCEFFPGEAVKTNVLGASNVIEACKANRVSRAILLSTDKAVYPINAMGMTKALMEKFVQANARSAVNERRNSTFCLTRYGNVMASRGSVIPLFIEQILSGRPITITDPQMTRFLMSLSESVDLVLHAFGDGDDGDLFVQKAPACTVETLAQALFELFEAEKKIDIIGTRHGEKKYEVLVSREEMAKATDNGRYYRIPADTRSMNYHKYLESGDPSVNELLEYSSDNTERLDKDQVKNLLTTLPYIQHALASRSSAMSQRYLA